MAGQVRPRSEPHLRLLPGGDVNGTGPARSSPRPGLRCKPVGELAGLDVEHPRQRDDRAARPAPQPLRADPAARERARRARRPRQPGRRRCRAHAASPRRRARTARGRTALATIRSTSGSCRWSASVSDTGSSAGIVTITKPASCLRKSATSRAWRADRPDARDLGERARRAQQRGAVAGRGRVDDDEVVGLGAGGSSAGAGRAPSSFVIAISSLPPGAAATSDANAPDRISRSARRRGSCVASHSVSAWWTSTVSVSMPRAAQQARHARVPAELADRHPAPVARGRERQRGGHRGLADAALAGDHDHRMVENVDAGTLR